jgi:hypothetical protein
LRWVARFEQEQGRPPGSQDRWEYGFARQIAGWTEADWKARRAPCGRLYEAGVCLASGDACWTADEVALVGQVVGNIERAFGGRAERIIGGVTIKRTRSSKWPLGYAWRRCLGWEGLHAVRLNDSAFASGRAAHVLTHELGHYFEESRHLIGPFRKATGGCQFNLLGLAQLNITVYRPGGEPPNDWARRNGLYEDFAISFETFVYQQIGEPVRGNVLDPRRRLFFARFLSPLEPEV